MYSRAEVHIHASTIASTRASCVRMRARACMCTCARATMITYYVIDPRIVWAWCGCVLPRELNLKFEGVEVRARDRE